MKKISHRLLYSFGVLALALFSLPKLLLRGKNIRERLIPSPFPKIEGPCIWIHAVSVGEVKAVAVLAKHLPFPLIVSTITETGFQEAKRSIPQAAHHLILPIDLKNVMRRLLNGLTLKALIITETDFWFNFLQEAKALQAEIILVNGKLSDQSMKMRGYFKGFSNALFSMIDRFFLQSMRQRERFLSLGVLDGKIQVTGNLKFKGGGAPSSDLEEFKASLGIKDHRVVVFGSTHEGEETFLFGVIKELLERAPDVSVLVVPRHPERFAPVGQLMRGVTRVTVINQMGVLAKCYELADVAVVCGSFVDGIGGHNILEPLFFKVATLFGPFMEGQRDLVEAVLEGQGGQQVVGFKLVDRIVELLQNREERECLGERGFRVTEGAKGGVEDILHFLLASK